MDISPFDNSLPPHAKVTVFVIECFSFYEEVFRVKREFSVTKSRFRFLNVQLNYTYAVLNQSIFMCVSNYLNIFPSKDKQSNRASSTLFGGH